MLELNGVAQVFMGGMLGPTLLELWKLSSWRSREMSTKRYRRATYWIATLAVFLLSGMVTVLQGTEHVPLLRAVQLGINAPLLVATLANASSATGKKLHRRDAGLLPEIPAEKHAAKLSFLDHFVELFSW